MNKRKFFIYPLLALFLLNAGCAAFLLGAGAGTAGVIWYKGRLQETLPYSVPHVYEAAKAGLRDLDIGITEERHDKLTAKIKGKLADDTEVWVDAESKNASTTVLTIRVGILGDKAFTLRIRDAIKKHL